MEANPLKTLSDKEKEKPRREAKQKNISSKAKKTTTNDPVSTKNTMTDDDGAGVDSGIASTSKTAAQESDDVDRCTANKEAVTRQEFDSLNKEVLSLHGKLDKLLSLGQLASAGSGNAPQHHISDSEEEEEHPDEQRPEEGEISEEPRMKQYFKKVAGTTKDQVPTIDEELAAGTAHMLSMGLSKDAKEKLFEKYEIPGNCKRLEVIRCNQNIWNNATQTRKTKDARMQDTQKGILKSLTILSYAFDHILKFSDVETGLGAGDTEHISDLVTDAIGILADTSHDLDIKRRQKFRSEFKEEYAPLCTDKSPVVDALFGSDAAVTDKVKDISETIKLKHRVQRKYEPYKASLHKRNAFLEKGAPQYRSMRGGYNYNNKNQYNDFRPSQNHNKYNTKNKKFSQSQNTQKSHQRRYVQRK